MLRSGKNIVGRVSYPGEQAQDKKVCRGWSNSKAIVVAKAQRKREEKDGQSLGLGEGRRSGQGPRMQAFVVGICWWRVHQKAGVGAEQRYCCKTCFVKQEDL